MAPIDVWCILVDKENSPIYRPFEVSVEKHIAELKEAVLNEFPSLIERKLSASSFIVWRCNNDASAVVFGDNPDQFRKLFSDAAVTKLHSRKRIDSLELKDEETLLVQVPIIWSPESSTKKRRPEVDDTTTKRQKFIETREANATAARRGLRPSSAAYLETFVHQQHGKRPVLNGRPLDNFGPPIGLFHPVFNDFRADITSQEPVDLDATTYSHVWTLFEAFANIYGHEDKRMDKIEECLTDVLESRPVDLGVTGARSDGIIADSCGKSTAYLVIFEVKNEIGTGHTDPYNQGSLAYRKYWSSKPDDMLRKCSYCPSLILAIAGPWLCVSGGVFLQDVVIQPLTDYIWLGGDKFDQGRVIVAARLFSALRTAIKTLRTFYANLAPRLNSMEVMSDPFPFVTEFGSKKFKYLERLALDHPNKLLYKALLEDEDREVVVKFVTTYNVEAHGLLAAAELAPTLFYDGTRGPMYGGRYMIVMDFVDGDQAVNYLSQDQFEQIKKAIDLLHSRGFVFGDLRPPNILITKKGKVQIVDYDWVQDEEGGRYPFYMNMDAEIGWPEGAGPSCPMKKEHDIFMLKKLESQVV